jgi:argonaute-like protein implicated in RNA metabolism and viral defense
VLVTPDTWSRGDLIALWSLIGTAIAVATGLIAVVIAIHTLRRGNKNASVATMVPLNAEIRQMWVEYDEALASIDFKDDEELAALEEKIAVKLQNLMNVLEIAAAIELEGTLSGMSRVLMRDYLEQMLDMIIRDDYTNAKVSELLQDDTTYIFIRRFLKKTVPPNSILPAEWYVSPR